MLELLSYSGAEMGAAVLAESHTPTLARIGVVITFGTALIAGACGRQVTPNPPGIGSGGAPQGYMAVYFTVAAPFDFADYQYMFVFNTTGSGVTPSTDTIQKNWAGYSYALIAFETGGTAFAKPVKFYFNPANPHEPPGWQFLGSTPQQFSFNANSNGSGTELSMLVQDSVFAATPPPGHPSPSPSPYAQTWTFNAFVTQASSYGPWYFLDSMGAGGPIDPQFNSPSLCMTEPFDDNNLHATYNIPGNPSAQIVSVEIANNPLPSQLKQCP